MDTLDQTSFSPVASSELGDKPEVFSPNDPPWSTPAAVGLWVFSVLMIMLVPAFFLIPYLVSSGVMSQGSQKVGEFSLSDPTAIAIQMIAIIPAHLLTLAAAWMIVTNKRRLSFTEMLGFKSGGIKWFHHLLILLGFVGLAAIVSQFIPEAETQLSRILQSSRTVVLIVAFMATFTAPLVEEVVYRGVLYSAFQRSFGIPTAVAAVTFVFSLVHFMQYYESPLTMVLLTTLSLILTLMRVVSNNLLPCIIFHTLINGFQSVGLIAEPYLKQYVEPTTAAISFAIM